MADTTHPKAPKINRKHYPPIIPDKIVALVTYYHRRAIGIEYSQEEMEALIGRLLPFGSITKAIYRRPGDPPTPNNDPTAPAWAAGDGPNIGMGIKERGLRYYDPEFFMLNMVLTLYGNYPHIDNNTNKADPDQLHYLEAIGGGEGISALRLIANAQPGEDVRIVGEHHDQRMQSLEVVPGRSRSYRGRAEAEAAALAQYDKAAAKGRTRTLGLTREEYRGLIRAAFKLLDDDHGHKLRRQDLAPAAK